MTNSFNINDSEYPKEFIRKCFELGLDCMEFLFSCEMYFKFMNIEANIDSLNKAIIDVKDMTLEGRVLGSTTRGIYSLFRNKRKNENLITKPSITEEENFKINIPSRTDRNEDISDLEYLYSYILILENFGFCLFTSFAFLDNRESLGLLAELYYYKTGNQIDGTTLLEESLKAVKNEKKIPNFIKVLYRYFDTKS